MKLAAPPPKALVASSPGRAEKLPAPGLARLLRGKSGSRSRGRTGSSASRASPIFVSRSKAAARSSSMEPTEEEAEPSSPKVTCIGQVRIRNKNKKILKSRSIGTKPRPKPKPAAPAACCRCRCLELDRPVLCNIFSHHPQPGKPRGSTWRVWSLRLRSRKKPVGYRADPGLDPPPEAELGTPESDPEVESEESEGEEEETTVFVSSSATTTTPPKNALLLMRCRSAPHNRSSALATARISVSSPIAEGETPKAEEKEEAVVEEERDGGDRGVEEGSRPLVLIRCKSEPAKKAAMMVVPAEVTPERLWNSGLELVEEEEKGGPPPILLH